MVTSNLPFQEWTEILGSEAATGALLDRLTHHVHILEMNGDSFRLKQEPQKAPRNRRSLNPPTPQRTRRGAEGPLSLRSRGPSAPQIPTTSPS